MFTSHHQNAAIIWVLFFHHILDPKLIDSCPFQEFEADPRLQNITKLSINSNCFQVGCFKFHSPLAPSQCSIWKLCFHHKLYHNAAIKYCLFLEFQVDPRPEANWLLQIPFSSQTITMRHLDSMSLPYVGPRLNQFLSILRILS